MIPRRFAPLLFAILLTGFMTLVISGVATAINLGFTSEFLDRWIRAWWPNWLIAAPVLLIVRPHVQHLTDRWTARP